MVKRDGLVDKLRVTADGRGVVGHADECFYLTKRIG